MVAFLSFVLITAGVAVATAWGVRRDDRDEASVFFLAGRSLPWFVVSGTLLLTNISTEQLVGLNGAAYLHGMPVIAWEIFGGLGLVAFARWFLPRYRQAGITTIPQFVEERYDPATRRILAGLQVLSLVLNAMPFVLYSGAVSIVVMFDLPRVFGLGFGPTLWLTTIAAGALGTLYALRGGLKAVAIFETLNGVGFIGGSLLVAWLVLRLLGQGSAGHGLREVAMFGPALDPFGAADSEIPWPALFTGMVIINLSSWCTNHNNIQRVLGARSLAEGQKGAYFTALLKLLGPLYLVLPGLVAARLSGPQRLPADGVYPWIAGAVLPRPLTGLFGAVVFGSVIGAFSSALHSAVTIFAVDIYRGALAPAADERAVVRMGRRFGLAVAACAIALAPLAGRSAVGFFGLMKRINAAFSIPILAVVAMAVLAVPVTGAAARRGIACGFLFYATLSGALDNRIFGVRFHWLHSVALSFLLTAGTILVLSRGAPRRPLYPKMHDAGAAPAAAELPWAGGKAAALGILLAAVAIYGGLSWLAGGA